MHAPTPRLSATPGTIHHPAPALGADTDRVLNAAGFASNEIEALRARGVVGP